MLQRQDINGEVREGVLTLCQNKENKTDKRKDDKTEEREGRDVTDSHGRKAQCLESDMYSWMPREVRLPQKINQEQKGNNIK